MNDQGNKMIVTQNSILEALLAGDHKISSTLINKLLTAEVSAKHIYEEYLKPSLYKVGELWEQNKISVATEHLASAIAESLINEVYLKLKSAKKSNQTVIVTCLENEHHQIGARMVSDIFEMNGWDVLFLGANTPKKDLIGYIRAINPQLAAISISIYFHLPTLESTLAEVKTAFPQLPVLIGGQAFTRGGKEILSKYEKVNYISDLDSLENFINQF